MGEKKRVSAKRNNRRRQKKRQRQQRALVGLTAVLVLLLVAGAAVFALSPKQGKTVFFDASRPAREVEIAGPVITLEPEPEEEAPEEADAATAAARDAEADEEDALVTAESVVQTQAREATDYEYLPVYRRADIVEKKIAITVDDCYQVDNLRTIINTARNSGGRLTLFPIGENLSRDGMRETLFGAMKAGFEIENHTWSHERVFRLPEFQMAEQIWRQSAALNQLLGVNYQQHFFRLMGGDGSSDQRTHNYLMQLGYLGIAGWSVSGSDSTLEAIKSSLDPGQIYLFHTTNGDTEKLKLFIPYAVSQGYKLVTLNELLGYPNNEISVYQETSMPLPQSYQEDYRTHKVGDYAWNILLMQDKLRSLGFLQMDGESTGYYGEQTAVAVMAYQRSMGLAATGVADSETQRRLLGT